MFSNFWSCGPLLKKKNFQEKENCGCFSSSALHKTSKLYGYFTKLKNNSFFLRFWLYFGTCGILIPQPGTEPEPPALEAWSLPSIFPSIRVCPSESVLHIRWPEYWSFSFSISPANEYSGRISFRIQCFLSLTLMSNCSRENQLSVSFFI